LPLSASGSFSNKPLGNWSFELWHQQASESSRQDKLAQALLSWHKGQRDATGLLEGLLHI